MAPNRWLKPADNVVPPHRERRSRRVEALVGVGLLGLAVAAALWTVWLPAERAELAALRELASSAAIRAARDSARAPMTALQSPGEGFLAAFEKSERRPQRVQALLAASARHGVQWRRSEFRVTREPGLGIARYRVTLPLTGSYGAIRRFVDDALTADPGLALDRLQLRRPSATSEQVDAESVWSLYTRDAAKAPAAMAALPVRGGR